MRATRFLGSVLLAGCSNLARVLPDAPTGEPPPRPPEALVRPRVSHAESPESFRLGNGLAVVLLPERAASRLALELRFDVGRRDEEPSTRGAAADYATRAAAARDPQLARRLAEGRAWVVAQAGLDDTRLVVEAPRALLPELLELVAEALTEPAREGTLSEPDPASEAELALRMALYPEGHPYRPLPAASPDAGAVARFQRERFVPTSAALVLAGGFEPAAAKAVLEAQLARAPRAEPPARRPAPPSGLEAPVRVELSSEAERTVLTLAWHSPPRHAPGEAELRLAAALLAEGPTARLARRLVLDTRLAEEVTAVQESAALGSLFRIDLRTAPGTDLVVLEQEVLAVLEAFVREGPSRSELERARERAVAREELRLAGLLARVSAAQDTLRTAGTPDFRAAARARWSTLSPEGVRAASAAVLTAPHVTIVLRPRH